MLGWTEGAELGELAYDVSKLLAARVHAIRDTVTGFHVLVYERGNPVGAFEQPPTIWAEGKRVGPVLGYGSSGACRRARALV